VGFVTRAEIDKLFERLARHVNATKRHSGEGAAWQLTLPNGEIHTYGMFGVRTHAEAMDSAENLIMWIWASKDYLKKRANYVGKESRSIEEFVNQNFFLSVCADLANRLKHGGLDKSRGKGPRSGMNPKLGEVSFTFPQTAIGSLVFSYNYTGVNVSDPEKVEVKLPILAENGDHIGDAFDFAYQAIQALEHLRKKVDAAVQHPDTEAGAKR
jgi:hypothetical protein